jgi:hypothetical protein
MTFGMGFCRVFIDGEPSGVGARSSSRSFGFDFEIGSSGANPFSGQIAEVRVWREVCCQENCIQCQTEFFFEKKTSVCRTNISSRLIYLNLQQARTLQNLRSLMHVRLFENNLPDALAAYWPFSSAEKVPQNVVNGKRARIVGKVEWFMSGPHVVGKLTATPINIITVESIFRFLNFCSIFVAGKPSLLTNAPTAEYSRLNCSELGVNQWPMRSDEAQYRGVCSSSKLFQQCQTLNFTEAERICHR